MNIEKIILDFIKSENLNLEIAGLRGLVKMGEDEWGFRYTYRDGDYLTMSELVKVKFDTIKAGPVFIAKKRIPRKTKITK